MSKFEPKLFLFMRLHHDDDCGYRMSHIGMKHPGYLTAEAALADAPRALAGLRGGRLGSRIVLVGVGGQMEVFATVAFQDFKLGGQKEQI